MPTRYAELTPRELESAWRRNPVAILPIGALEWHGPHLPMGLDGIVAERFSEELAEASTAVLLPTLWTPITTLPHAMSLDVPTEAFRLVIDATLAKMHRAGARRIAVVTGHYAQGHEIELYEAALRAMDDLEDLLVFAAAPLEPLGKAELLDHAAHYEACQLLAYRPDLVHLDQLGEVAVAGREEAVLGEDPRSATAEEGRRLLDQAVEAWKAWIVDSDPASLEKWYMQAFDRYQSYIDAYFQGSWEDAIERWWGRKGDEG